MTKKFLIPLLSLALIFALFLIKVEQEKTTSVPASFLNVFATLSNPQKWPAWQNSLRKASDADSGGIRIAKQKNQFSIKYDSLTLDVTQAATFFTLKQTIAGRRSDYTYTIIPGEFDKKQANTAVVTGREVSLGRYLLGLVAEPDFSETHSGDLKRYFESDSLYYGFRIVKTGVPEANLIEVTKTVLKKDKFNTAASLLADLQAYIRKNNVKQMQPLIAQFLRKGTDSTKVNVGFFIDREVRPDKVIHFVRMPLGGALYCAVYKGSFDKRQRVYNALDQYFTNHLYQQAIIPFEMYLDNQLPKSDTDKVNIRLNYTAYY